MNTLKKSLVDSAWIVCIVTLVWQQSVIWTIRLDDSRFDEIRFRMNEINQRLAAVVIVEPVECQPVEDGVLMEVVQGGTK